ncbi:MAG: SIR2 family NAD-dependent protein deacylase [Miltoncostaeaceae bacterium]
MADDLDGDIRRLADLLAGSERCVAMTGVRLGATEDTEAAAAGSAWGEFASLEVLLTEPARFWENWLPRAIEASEREVTPAHRALARLEGAGVIHAIITQAVDHLHARAGDGDLIEVHANVLSCRCARCDDVYALSEVQGLIDAADDGVPRCTREGCGYPLRPTGTLWGEPLVEEAIIRAWDMAAWCDLFLVLDTQLRTDPMAMLPSVPLKRGGKVAIAGTTRTHYDRYAKLVIPRTAPEVLPGVADLLAPAG